MNNKDTVATALFAISALNGGLATLALDADTIIRSWKDPTFAQTLSPEQRRMLPADPAGIILLQQGEQMKIAGTQNYPCTNALSCTQGLSCTAGLGCGDKHNTRDISCTTNLSDCTAGLSCGARQPA